MMQFVDSDHAGNMMNFQPRTGILIYLCRAPIVWYSKKKNIFESTTFGLEIVAMRTGMELNKGLRYKLMVMDIPIDGP